jgi:hypothetical protein
MQDAEVELIMRTLVNSVQTYEEVIEVRGCCGCTGAQFSYIDPSITASSTDPSVQRWYSNPTSGLNDMIIACARLPLE